MLTFCLIFLFIETKLAFLHVSGNIPLNNYSSNIIFKGIVSDSLQIFIILINILSYQCDLLESNDFIVDNISFIFNKKRIYSSVGLI